MSFFFGTKRRRRRCWTPASSSWFLHFWSLYHPSCIPDCNWQTLGCWSLHWNVTETETFYTSSSFTFFFNVGSGKCQEEHPALRAWGRRCSVNISQACGCQRLKRGRRCAAFPHVPPRTKTSPVWGFFLGLPLATGWCKMTPFSGCLIDISRDCLWLWYRKKRTEAHAKLLAWKTNCPHMLSQESSLTNTKPISILLVFSGRDVCTLQKRRSGQLFQAREEFLF